MFPFHLRFAIFSSRKSHHEEKGRGSNWIKVICVLLNQKSPHDLFSFSKVVCDHVSIRRHTFRALTFFPDFVCVSSRGGAIFAMPFKWKHPNISEQICQFRPIPPPFLSTPHLFTCTYFCALHAANCIHRQRSSGNRFVAARRWTAGSSLPSRTSTRRCGSCAVPRWSAPPTDRRPPPPPPPPPPKRLRPPLWRWRRSCAGRRRRCGSGRWTSAGCRRSTAWRPRRWRRCALGGAPGFLVSLGWGDFPLS